MLSKDPNFSKGCISLVTKDQGGQLYLFSTARYKQNYVLLYKVEILRANKTFKVDYLQKIQKCVNLLRKD